MIYLVVLKLKTKWFHKWAIRNRVEDHILLKTIEHVSNNIGTNTLGKCLYKVRLSRTGQGKRGGFRTILIFQADTRAIFVYGFAKNERDNLGGEELKYFKKLTKDLLEIDIKEIIKLEESGVFISLKE